MAEHAPTPWQIDHVDPDGRRCILDPANFIVARVGPTDDDRRSWPDPCDRDATANLIVRAVNAVAGTQPGPVDLDVALCLADQALMGDFPAVGEAIQALVGEVVRLREEIQDHVDEMYRQHPVVTPRRVRDELDDESSLYDPFGWLGP